MATQFCREAAAGPSGLPRASVRCLHRRLPVVEEHRLRFGGSRPRSIRHADCSLLHFTGEQPLRSELKPG